MDSQTGSIWIQHRIVLGSPLADIGRSAYSPWVRGSGEQDDDDKFTPTKHLRTYLPTNRTTHRTQWGLAFTRYCHCQYCVVCIAITGGRGQTLCCAIVCAMTGWGGVPNQRVRTRRIVLIRAQRPRQNNILYRPKWGASDSSLFCLWPCFCRMCVWPVSLWIGLILRRFA